MRLASPLLALVFILAGAIAAAAHEFWIAPAAYQVESGGTITAAIRVGQQFEGAGYAYIPNNFVRFDLVQGDRVVPVAGRMGDRPALDMAPPGDGLWVVVHQTTHNFLIWAEWQKFEEFVTGKGAAWTLAEHARRGLPDSGFRERYSRYGKSLVTVGEGAGADRAVGLLTEIVALANPYTDDLSGGLRVRVLYEGKPRADAQLDVFARAADGSVTLTAARTDADGIAVVPVQPGVEYLLDAVVLRPMEPPGDSSPVWESLWASLTFRVPG